MKLQLNTLGHPQEPVIGEVEITLSRRNLLALLHKLDWEGSARTIQKMVGGGVVLTVVAEDDDEHYGDDGAGVMHDETERFIETHGSLPEDD
jgi:hypothetical protein